MTREKLFSDESLESLSLRKYGVRICELEDVGKESQLRVPKEYDNLIIKWAKRTWTDEERSTNQFARHCTFQV
ncbi:MAG: hypothetical protein LRY71_19150 [Bacillaceae bacterium]|nr:hypothetical protein [Bacillaceae bacterium]